MGGGWRVGMGGGGSATRVWKGLALEGVCSRKMSVCQTSRGQAEKNPKTPVAACLPTLFSFWTQLLYWGGARQAPNTKVCAKHHAPQYQGAGLTPHATAMRVHARHSAHLPVECQRCCSSCALRQGERGCQAVNIVVSSSMLGGRGAHTQFRVGGEVRYRSLVFTSRSRVEGHLRNSLPHWSCHWPHHRPPRPNV